MRKRIALAFVVAAAVPAFAQQSGTATPPDATVLNLPPAASVPQVTPAAAATPVSAAEVFGEYKPYGATTTAPVLRPRTPRVDPDADIVTEVPRKHGELPAGTALRMRLNLDINTETTQAGTPFTAELAENVTSEGVVVLPAGSTVEGHVTEVRGGKRIRGTAMIHLQVDDVVLPDGTSLALRAAVIDTDQFAQTRVDGEGNILRKDHVGATLATMSLTTGGAAAAGGVFGGAPGALIGAGVGAGLSTVMWLKRDRQAYLPEGAMVVLNLTEPMSVIAALPRVAATPIEAAPKPEPKADVTTAAAPQAFVPTN